MLQVLIRSASVSKVLTYVFVEKQENYLPDTHSYLDLCHNICFNGELKKIIAELSSNTPP